MLRKKDCDCWDLSKNGVRQSGLTSPFLTEGFFKESGGISAIVVREKGGKCAGNVAKDEFKAGDTA
jgi:hypothetical protein